MDISNINIIKLLTDILINGAIVFLTAKVLPGIEVRNFVSSLWVAAIYGLLNAAFIFLFGYFGLDSINNLVGQGIFQIIFNALLLMLTDRILEDFYVKNFLFALLAAVVIAFLSGLVRHLIG